MQFVLVGLGGFLGAIARYSVNRFFASRAVLERSVTETTLPAYPLSTLLVNVLGSFLIGFIVFYAASRPWFSADARLFLVTGFLGAFTTFSAFSLESLQLLEAGETGRALMNIVLNLVLCLLFVWVGAVLARSLSTAF